MKPINRFPRPRMLQLRAYEACPDPGHAWIVKDKLWQLYNEPARNWNMYEPIAASRWPEIRTMSGRVVVMRCVVRKPVDASVYVLANKRYEKHRQYLDSLRQRK